MTDNQYLVKPVIAAFKVLGELNKAGGPLSLAEVAARAELNRTTTFRYLKTMCALGYANLTADGEYEIGPAALLLVTEDARERALRCIAEPEMFRLRDKFGETVNLGVAKGKRIHYLTILESKKPLRLRAEVGDSDCFHCTALGKAILAYLPAEEVGDHLNNPLLRLTEHTITTRRRLDQALAEVRRFGYSIDREENEIGCICFAAPILMPGERPVGAISISVPTPRLTDRLDVLVADEVKGAADRISSRMSESRTTAEKTGQIRSARGRR
ncbi:MAG: IclR family transcriptional regulator [Bauldia sp.]|nr:IclR family transcriptional regulator [Bauldia sp.]